MKGQGGRCGGGRYKGERGNGGGAGGGLKMMKINHITFRGINLKIFGKQSYHVDQSFRHRCWVHHRHCPLFQTDPLCSNPHHLVEQERSRESRCVTVNKRVVFKPALCHFNKSKKVQTSLRRLHSWNSLQIVIHQRFQYSFLTAVNKYEYTCI
jgi:hypothetical protein